MNKIACILLFVLFHQHCFAYGRPSVQYTIKVDTNNLQLISVKILLLNIPDTFRLAMFAHPEYDDKYWRYVENMQAKTENEGAVVFREDSAVWRIITHHHKATISYVIRLPQLIGFRGMRSAWKPFLSATGGLLGDYHCLMYVIGETSLPSFVRLQIPNGWQIATGLQPTHNPFNFFAANASVLMDAPILIGHVNTWQFAVRNTTHTIAYWPLPGAVSFDTTELKNDIQKLVQQSVSLFRSFPYRKYFFLLQDGSYGALEHSNSVTIGLPSVELHQHLAEYLQEVAHEYFHAWNMKYIHPAEYGDVNYMQPPLSRGLWWSEGATMFYADLLLRRAGIAFDTSSRITHLEALIKRWYDNAGNNKIAPEKVSMSDCAPPGYLGDYDASTHLQGEVMANLLDMIICNGSDGKHSLDDVMRAMLKFAGRRGFTGKDIEQLTAAACNCDVHTFFENYIRSNKTINFNDYLNLAGLTLHLSWKPATTGDTNLLPDKRVYVWKEQSSNSIRLLLTDPESCWGRAGLHTRDVVKKINDTLVKNTNDFYNAIKNIEIGNNINIEVERNAEPVKATLKIMGYQEAEINIVPISQPSAKQKRIKAAWLTGK